MSSSEPLPGVAPPVLGRLPYWARVLIGRANRLKPFPGFTEEDMMTVWERYEGRCGVSGLKFREVLVGTGWARNPYVLARSLSAALMMGAVALTAVTVGSSVAPAQELDWARSAGSLASDEGSAIASDPRGNSYVTGSFRTTATFGAGEANETELEAGGLFDLDTFVAKYAPDGHLLWATSAGGTGEEQGFGIATDPRGNSYVTGHFALEAIFGAGEDNETRLSAAGARSNVFVAKYAPAGHLLWATSAGGTGSDVCCGIATDPRGNSYVTGGFEETATFGEGEANEIELQAAGSAGDTDVFVAKYAPAGHLLWATSAGGAGGDQGFGIAADPRGNSYVTGSFSGTARFGAGGANETELQAAGAAGELDMFVAKYALTVASSGPEALAVPPATWARVLRPLLVATAT